MRISGTCLSKEHVTCKDARKCVFFCVPQNVAAEDGIVQAAMQKHTLWGVIGVGVLLVGAYFFLNHVLYKGNPNKALEPVRTELAGTYACLQHKDAASAEDGNCLPGLRTEDGLYYALDTGLMSQGKPPLAAGDRISAQGILTPIERLSTDFWDTYTVTGIFSVTSDLLVEPAIDTSQASSTALIGTSWVWQYTELQNGERMQAPEGEQFVLTLAQDQSFQSTTDCNSLSGSYTLEGKHLEFADIAATMMYCEGSSEGTYVQALSQTASYEIEGNNLRIIPATDAGVMVFTAR